MSKIDWFSALEKIKPFLFKIETPSSSGTGFQIYLSVGSDLCAVATAGHVISHEDDWEEPIKLIHNESGRSVLLRVKDRAIFRYDNDTAVIVFSKNELPIKEMPLKLIKERSLLKQGVEVGWYGFPSVSINSLCFFAGHISCQPGVDKYYLVDGVVINGVSGGPVFYITKESDIIFAGIISAYIPNRRSTGESLPGLGVVRIIDKCQEVIQNLQNLEEAKKKEEEEAKKKEEEEAKKKEEEEAKKKEEEEAKKKEEEEAKKKKRKLKKQSKQVKSQIN